MTKKITTQGLRKFNIIMGFLHLTQAVLVLLLSTNFLLPISGNYLAFNTTSESLEPATKALFNLSLPALIILFLFLSSVAHFVIATIYNKQYNKDLGLGINKARWIEYSLSASVMMVAVALLVGIYDSMSLLMIFVLVASMNLLGLVMEIHNLTTKKNKLGKFLGRLSYWYCSMDSYRLLYVARRS